MIIYRIRNKEEYFNHKAKSKATLSQHHHFLSSHTPEKEEKFFIPGYSYTADQMVEFEVDYQHSGSSGIVNWRERVSCPLTYFNNRMRATFHLFDIEMGAYPDSKLYITEQVTPIYKYFADRFINLTGSEFIGEQIPWGALNELGIRNEDLSRLTFPDNEFDGLISLDVLEHIPKYEESIKECFRVLKPGGKMMWSVPFIADHYKNSIRAEIIDGEIVHLQPPEYHGDPLSDKGVLCFQHFGWEMLDQFRLSGFRDAYAMVFHSTKFGYLGGEQIVFMAIK